MNIVTFVGGVAALCTTVSYLPQLIKCWQTGHTGDLSLGMFSVLAAGVALWVFYGVLKGDWVIIAANTVSLLFLAGILIFKVKELQRS
jgi:MtN3 and saliva related transmembrane protein